MTKSIVLPADIYRAALRRARELNRSFSNYVHVVLDEAHKEAQEAGQSQQCDCEGGAE